jgi:hypothetical protein
MSALAWALAAPWVLAQATTPAPGEARPSEDELFGAPPADAVPSAPLQAPAENAPAPSAPAAPGPPSTAAEARDAETLSGGPLMRRDIREEVAEDKLEIGGDLLLRFQSTYATETDALDQGLSTPSLLDVYLDARPSERVRVYAEGRLTYDPTLENGRAAIPDFCTPTDSQGNPETAGLDAEARQTLAECQAARDALAQAFATPAETSGLTQLWLKFDIEQTAFVTLGRQPVKWGAARLWNPTDFLNRQQKNPLEQTDLRTGVSLIKVHVPWESQAANFYAVGQFDEARRIGDVGGALRAEVGFESAEVSLTAAGRRDHPLLLGADVSVGFWQVDLYAEGAVAHGHHRPLPGEPDRSDEWLPHVSGGFSVDVNYGDEDTFTWGVEYAFNEDGVDDPAQFGNALAAGRSVFTLPRQAAGGYVVLLAPGRLDDSSIFVTSLVNLDDRSGTARAQWSERVLTWLSVQPYVGVYFGDEGDLFRANLNAADAAAPAAYLTADAGVWLSARL